ncbi:MAG: hypothetical protein QOE73_2540 [Verrucomicrobiota bacterium]
MRLPSHLIFFRNAAAFCLSLIALTPAVAGDFFEQLHDKLSIHSPDGKFSLQITGLLDLEGYYLDQPAPGLIFTEDNFLINPRLSLFLDASFTSHLNVFVQARVDRHFDPSDAGAQVRLDEYFLRYTPLETSAINIQFGKFGTVVGNWVPRHYSWDNPFVTAPLPYENLTGIWDGVAVDQVDTLFYWGHVGEYNTPDYSDKYMRLPIIWGPSYATGVAISGSLGKFDYAAEMKNRSLSSRPESWDATQVDFSDPTFSGRVGFRPNEMWNVGFSVSAGPYLLPEAGPTLPIGDSVGDYRELVLAQDVSFAWHHFQLWAEFYEARFEVPIVGDADTFSYYLEAKYKITPQLFAALRWNQQLYGTVRDEGEWVKWGNDIWRVDAAVGYRFTNNLQAKIQYSFNCEDADPSLGASVVAVQLTVKF